MSRLRRFVLVLATCQFLLCCTGSAWAASKLELDARIRSSFDALYSDAPAARELAAKAVAILIFPRVYKAGAGFGGKYGEGALMIDGAAVQYYRVTSGSIGFQLGIQARAEVLLFMTSEALRAFRESDGWEAGLDGSVAIIQFGVGERIDTYSGRDPIIGFVYGNKGLMYDLSLEGTKYWRIVK